jgi:hypothetical protein
MRPGRTPCCLTPRSHCGTRFRELVAWTSRVTGKGVRLVDLEGDEQGRAPFHAQPVGYDGRAFHVAHDHGCDTEKLLHEVCHWFAAPKARRVKPNYGLGPAGREVDDVTGDNEEVTVMLLERALAPHFALPLARIAKPDYNVANRRNVDWDACEARAGALYDACAATLPAREATPRAEA